MLTSPDAITWHLRPSFPAEGLLAYGKGRVVAANWNTMVISDPVVPSAPLLGLEHAANQLFLRITGRPGVTYDFEQSSDLRASSWPTLQTLTLTNNSQTVPLAALASSNLFWRARRW